MRIGIIADVHGNTWALETVLDDMERRRCDMLINAGDSVFGPLDPAGSAAILMNLDAIAVRGNQDRALTHDPTGNPTLAFVLDELTRDQVAWFGFLPETETRDGILVCHGTPQSDEAYLMEDVSSGRAALASEATIVQRLNSHTADIVVCGHSHLQRTCQAGGSLFCINPGSVGLPAYEVGGDSPHVMESGSPHARYAVLERRNGILSVELISLRYDWDRAARQAELNDRPDWASWIRTGRART